MVGELIIAECASAVAGRRVASAHRGWMEWRTSPALLIVARQRWRRVWGRVWGHVARSRALTSSRLDGRNAVVVVLGDHDGGSAGEHAVQDRLGQIVDVIQGRIYDPDA